MLARFFCFCGQSAFEYEINRKRDFAFFSSFGDSQRERERERKSKSV